MEEKYYVLEIRGVVEVYATSEEDAIEKGYYNADFGDMSDVECIGVKECDW